MRWIVSKPFCVVLLVVSIVLMVLTVQRFPWPWPGLFFFGIQVQVAWMQAYWLTR